MAITTARETASRETTYGLGVAAALAVGGELPEGGPVAAVEELAQRDFDAFYVENAPRLTRQIVALTGNRQEAQDVVQEAFARAWQQWPAVSGYDAPLAWVRTVASRLAISRWRRARNAVVAWRRHGPADPLPGVSPDRVALVAALAQIPQAQRVAIVLHHLMDLSVEQVAQETGAPVGTVKARLSRGRAALAVLLADEPSVADYRSTGDGPTSDGRQATPHV